MTPHSEALLLVFSFSLCGSLCAVSLYRNERAHFWARADPEPATSSPWTSRSTEVDMTSPTDVLHSDGTSRDLEVDPSVDQNPYVTKEDHGLSRLPASRTPWIKTLTSTKIKPPSDIQNDEEGPQTEASDWPNFSKQGNMEQSFKPSPLATLQHFSSQAWSTKPKTPIDWNTETYTLQTPAETRFSIYQTLWKSSGATQTPYARGTLDGTTLPRGLTDNLQPSEETKQLTDAPTDSLTEPTVNMTNPDPEREERKGADQVKKEENGQSTTTVIEVTESYPEADGTSPIVPAHHSNAAGNCCDVIFYATHTRYPHTQDNEGNRVYAVFDPRDVAVSHSKKTNIVSGEAEGTKMQHCWQGYSGYSV
ncbi:hypothetical protein cypCar_00014645 [Cyprinus carpio]|nr:hypothetical protein cypCar_00014645 [Cyprinus carpio]